MKEVYIVSAVRTPMGSFGGALSSFSAVQLGSFAIEGALKRAKVSPAKVQEVLMGNVVSAGLGKHLQDKQLWELVLAIMYPVPL